MRQTSAIEDAIDDDDAMTSAINDAIEDAIDDDYAMRQCDRW